MVWCGEDGVEATIGIGYLCQKKNFTQRYCIYCLLFSLSLSSTRVVVKSRIIDSAVFVNGTRYRLSMIVIARVAAKLSTNQHDKLSNDMAMSRRFLVSPLSSRFLGIVYEMLIDNQRQLTVDAILAASMQC